ncbi:FUSC family protein [Microbacteriaceae bacterium K1510]|nr:FUSC family protein [Microbacteriaceae bacterium K1510]
MAAPVVAGWLADDVAAGLLGTIGAFTALYGTDRPYVNRAIVLATIALSFTAAITLGVLTQEFHVLALAAVLFIAIAATFLCNALRTGPPGAYMFALACAAGTAVPIGHLSAWMVGALVLAGGAFSWCVQMSGILVAPRGPERMTVTAAANAVARFAAAVGQPNEDEARHVAALALQNAWTALIGLQPLRVYRDQELTRLRSINRQLHLLFVDGINAGRSGSGLANIAARAKALGTEVTSPGSSRMPEQEGTDVFPLGHLGIRDSLRESLRWGSPALLAAFRVSVAAALAGLVGIIFGLDRAYWSMAAAVLVLHQGLDWTRTLQRGVERMAGTLIGLVLAGLVLAAGPTGLWLAATLAVLQFLIEMIVVRNYAVAVIFITAAALMIASGGQVEHDVAYLLWVRGSDTVVGCLIGFAVHLLTAPRSLAVPLPLRIVETLAALAAVVEFLAKGDVNSPAMMQARRTLQIRTTAVLGAYEAGVGATARDRKFAEGMWATVVATQRLAYHVLATCWSLEEAGPAETQAVSTALAANDGVAKLRQALVTISRAMRAGAKPRSLPAVPELLAPDLERLYQSLVVREDHPRAP